MMSGACRLLIHPAHSAEVLFSHLLATDLIIIALSIMSPRTKVTVLGAAGGIGQFLSLELKRNKQITELALYDLSSTAGIAADIADIATPAFVTGHSGADQLKDALKEADIVVFVAGATPKAGQDRDAVFPLNAGIIRQSMVAVASTCPKALVAIVTNPVNSLVPLAVEVLITNGVPDGWKRVFGVTTLDVMRSKAYAAQIGKKDVLKMHVPVVGGHAGKTIIPLISGSKPKVDMSPELNQMYITKVQEAWKVVQTAKDGKGTATASTAAATETFVDFLIKSKNGQSGLKEYAYIRIMEGMKIEKHSLKYFATYITVDKNGLKEVGLLPWAKLNAVEQKALIEAAPELMAEIQKGELALNPAPDSSTKQSSNQVC